MLIFMKLGGSMITDKQVAESFRREATQQIAEEIARAVQTQPDLKLLIGHGSGSFGHVTAKKYGTRQGVQTAEEWNGFTQVNRVAAKLNALVSETLAEENLPILRVQPSASTLSHDGHIVSMETETIQRALDHSLIPLVYGDVAFDAVRGGTIISTETIFFYLAGKLPVNRILLLGEVDGVYDETHTVIPEIKPSTFHLYEKAIGGSSGTDVTGGMDTKVRDMLTLIEAIPRLQIHIFNGHQHGLLERALKGDHSFGTLLKADD